MKIKIMFIGMIQQQVGWKAEKEIELPENSTAEDALAEAGIEWDQNKAFGFATIDGKKVDDKNQVLKEGMKMKVFPKSFGG